MRPRLRPRGGAGCRRRDRARRAELRARGGSTATGSRACSSPRTTPTRARLFGATTDGFFKDGINDAVVNGQMSAVNAGGVGTKAAAHYQMVVPAGGSVELRLRLSDRVPSAWVNEAPSTRPSSGFVPTPPGRGRRVLRDGHPRVPLAGCTHRDAAIARGRAVVQAVLSLRRAATGSSGDPAQPPPPGERCNGRNHEWTHLYNADVISMPDKWEYPWYAAWDLAFHCVPLALVDPEFAKQQLVLLLREWYMHPNGQLPAYEWAFGDVNPPVHAWAAWRVYKIEKKRTRRRRPRVPRARVPEAAAQFHLVGEPQGRRGHERLPGRLPRPRQHRRVRSHRRSCRPAVTSSSPTARAGWRCTASTCSPSRSSSPATTRPTRTSPASSGSTSSTSPHAMNNRGDDGIGLWDEEDGFFYDVLHLPDGERRPLKVRSMVGLIPLFAVETHRARDARPAAGVQAADGVVHRQPPGPDPATSRACARRGTASAGCCPWSWPDRLRRVLQVMLDESEFLSDYGIRALSRRHLRRAVQPDRRRARASRRLRAGRIVERALRRQFELARADLVSGQLPAGRSRCRSSPLPGRRLPRGVPDRLRRASLSARSRTELSQRLTRIFLRDADGRRPVFGGRALFNDDPHWQEMVPFHEYFHGDTGAGVGASHQTGWTALVAKLLQQSGEHEGARDRRTTAGAAV